MACILLYILLALRRPFKFDSGAGHILFYVDVSDKGQRFYASLAVESLDGKRVGRCF